MPTTNSVNRGPSIKLILLERQALLIAASTGLHLSLPAVGTGPLVITSVALKGPKVAADMSTSHYLERLTTITVSRRRDESRACKAAAEATEIKVQMGGSRIVVIFTIIAIVLNVRTPIIGLVAGPLSLRVSQEFSTFGLAATGPVNLSDFPLGLIYQSD
jgi:hypothetical protein